MRRARFRPLPILHPSPTRALRTVDLTRLYYNVILREVLRPHGPGAAAEKGGFETRSIAIMPAPRLICLAAVVALPASGCDRHAQAPSDAAPRLRVAVSIPPQACFVERVGGAHVRAHVLLSPGQSPATFDPTLKQVAALAGARAYFRIGVAFEQRLLPRLAEAHPNLEIVDTRRGIPLRPMDDAGHAAGDAHAANTHAGAPDPHIWLSPRLVKIQARTICETLRRLDPAHAGDYERNLRAFHADLDALDARLAELFAPMKGRAFFVYHPAYGYLAEAYGLRQVAVEAGGREPGPRQLAERVRRAREARVRWILVQRRFASRSAYALAEAIGATVVTVDPLAKDYLENLWDMAAVIGRAVEAHPEPRASR